MKKDENLNTKEINKKKIQRLRKLLSFGETMLMVGPMLIIGMAIIVGILVAMSSGEGNFSTDMNEIVGMEVMPSDGVEYGIEEISTLIFSTIGYIIYILIVDRIKKILINVEKDETPFTEKNIILLSKIKKLTVISFFTMFIGNEFGISLIPLIIVLALSVVFEHGCELQKEVDETL